MPVTLSFTQRKNGLTQGMNGQFSYSGYWRLDPAPTADGLIIQKVKIDYHISACDGTRITDITARNPNIGYDTYPEYWELWTVAAGKKFPTYNAGGTAVEHNAQQAGAKPWDDDYGMDESLHGTNTRGWVRYEGVAAFYLVTNFANWAQQFAADANSPAGILPIATADPVLPNPDSNTVHHNVAAYWDGCLNGARRLTRVKPFAVPGLWPDNTLSGEVAKLAQALKRSGDGEPSTKQKVPHVSTNGDGS